MAQLKVLAEVTNGIYLPGGYTGPSPAIYGPYLIVYVTNAEGDAQQNLKRSNFVVQLFEGGTNSQNFKAPADFSEVSVHYCHEHSPGLYVCAFDPPYNAPQEGQKFIYAVAVSINAEGDRLNSHYGQTLTSLIGMSKS